MEPVSPGDDDPEFYADPDTKEYDYDDLYELKKRGRETMLDDPNEKSSAD